MNYTDKDLNKIYNKTDGYCHLCHRKISWSNYGFPWTRGAWEVDHSVPKAFGGTDNMNNLFPACIECNRRKGANSTRSERAKNGFMRAPYSRGEKIKKWVWNTVTVILGIFLVVVLVPWLVRNGRRGMKVFAVGHTLASASLPAGVVCKRNL